MKIASLVLIIFSFFATFADSVICIGHDSYGTENVISFVKAIDSNTQNNQTDFSPFDHCEVCPDSCNVNVAFIVNSSKEIFFSSPLITKISFIYKGLKLNSFLSNSERPPTLV
jgi:hypothetical protein